MTPEVSCSAPGMTHSGKRTGVFFNLQTQDLTMLCGSRSQDWPEMGVIICQDRHTAAIFEAF